MKKPLLFITLVALLAIGATIIAILTVPDVGLNRNSIVNNPNRLNNESNSAKEATNSVSDTTSVLSGPQNEQLNLIKKTFEELLTSNETLVCFTEYTQNDQNFTGNIYLNNNKVQANFIVTDNRGTKYMSNLLKLEKEIYVWEATQKVGLQITLDREDDLPDIENLAKVPASVFYDCEEQESNENTFELPKDVTFYPYTLNLDEILGNETFCEYCEQAPDEFTRLACLKELKCIH